jgi:hypothetical protein
VPERGALSFSLVFLWAYKEKVTRQQAKPQPEINTDFIQCCGIEVTDSLLFRLNGESGGLHAQAP